MAIPVERRHDDEIDRGSIFLLDVLWLPLGSAFMPAGYLLGKKMPLLGRRLTRATEWGEFLTGAGFGLALAFTFL